MNDDDENIVLAMEMVELNNNISLGNHKRNSQRENKSFQYDY